MNPGFYQKFTKVSLLLALVLVSTANADDRSRTGSFENNKDHWLFEFDFSSKKPLGTSEDVSSIKAFVALEARRTAKSAHPSYIDIRWSSPTLAIGKTTVTGVVATTEVLCVCEKRQSGWQLLYVYRFAPSLLSPKEKILTKR